MRFKEFYRNVQNIEGVYTDYLFVAAGTRLIHYTIKGYKLYKAMAYNWRGDELGEAQWDGICFFVPEYTQEVKMVFMEEGVELQG